MPESALSLRRKTLVDHNMQSNAAPISFATFSEWLGFGSLTSGLLTNGLGYTSFCRCSEVLGK